MNSGIIDHMTYQKVRHDITCTQCGVGFQHSHQSTKVCSEKCRKERNNIITGRKSRLEIPTGTVGSVSEMLVAVDLMRKGYAVFRALSPACFCDLICIKNGTVLKIECRTGYKHPFSEKIHFPRKTWGDIDLIAVFVHHDSEIHYFYSDFTEAAPPE